jgi:Response regulator receiver domain/Transposase, Mutator family
MPVIDGIETTRQLTKLHPAVAIVVLTTYADETSILAALRAGACSYLTKDADRVEIASALHSAVSGLSVLDPTVRAALLAAATRSAPSHEAPPARPDVLPDGLTRREAEILAMMGVTQGCKGGHRVLPASFISTLMSAEADAACGAGPARVNVLNGCRHRDFDTRAGTLDVAIPKLRPGRGSARDQRRAQRPGERETMLNTRPSPAEQLTARLRSAPADGRTVTI